MLYRVGQDLYLPRGDTGKLRINIEGDYRTTSDDRILFTVKKGEQPIIIRVLTPVDNRAILEFTNVMTKNLEPYDYRYDIRLVRDAILDSNGIPVGGEGVDTPRRKGVFHLLKTVGDV